MGYKKIISLLFILSLIGLSVAYFILEIYNCGNSSFCFYLYTDLGRPLFYGMAALSLVFFILLFVPKAFSAWKKFAIWFVPLAALLFIIWPTSSGSGLGVAPSFIGPSAMEVYQWVSALYVVVSIAIIATSTLKRTDTKK